MRDASYELPTCGCRYILDEKSRRLARDTEGELLKLCSHCEGLRLLDGTACEHCDGAGTHL